MKFISLKMTAACLVGGVALAAPARAEEAREPVAPPEAAAPAPEGRRHLGSVSVDPLGFLLFGPRVGAEVGLGKLSLGARFRWFDVGLLSNELFVADGNRFAFSFGAAVEGRYYFMRELEAVYAGVTLELLRTSIETSSLLLVANSLYFVPQLTGGYRFAFGSLFVDPSASLGYAAQIDAKTENMPGGALADVSSVQDKSSVYGAVALDLGILF